VTSTEVSVYPGETFSFSSPVDGSGYHKGYTQAAMAVPVGWVGGGDFAYYTTGYFTDTTPADNYYTNLVSDPDHTETFSGTVAVPADASPGDYLVEVWGAGCDYTEVKASDMVPILVHVLAPVVHDVAIVDVVPYPTEVTAGELVSVDVTAENQGTETETFDVTCYYDATVIGVETITLAAGELITLTFTWDTTGVAEGTYTISAEASVVPDEVDTADNVFVDGTVTVLAPPVVAYGPCDLVKKSAWPEHHHFDISKDEDGIQTLFGKVRNEGTLDTLCAVEFRIYDAKTGALVETLLSGSVMLAPGAEADLTADWTPILGKYYCEARALYDSDGDGLLDAYGAKVKTFKFAVVE